MAVWLIVLPFLTTTLDLLGVDQSNVQLVGSRTNIGGAGGRGGDASVIIQNVPGGNIFINPRGGDGGAGGDVSRIPRPTRTPYYYVGPVFPPDPWLALRTQPSDHGGERIRKMPEGTMFQVLGRSNDWYKVQLRDGTIGWAHSGWIQCCRYID